MNKEAIILIFQILIRLQSVYVEKQSGVAEYNRKQMNELLKEFDDLLTKEK